MTKSNSIILFSGELAAYQRYWGGGVEISTTHVQRCVRLHRFLRVQIENNFLWATSWVLKGALTGLSTAFDNNLRYF